MRSKTPIKPEEPVAPSTEERVLTATELREKRLNEEGARKRAQAILDGLNKAVKARED